MTVDVVVAGQSTKTMDDGLANLKFGQPRHAAEYAGADAGGVVVLVAVADAWVEEAEEI